MCICAVRAVVTPSNGLFRSRHTLIYICQIIAGAMQNPACPFLRANLVRHGFSLFVEETRSVTQLIYHAPAVRLRPPLDRTGGKRPFTASVAVIDPSATAQRLICIENSA